jgi:hypothetical protein
MEDTEKEVERLFRCQRTLKEMLLHRGFDVDEHEIDIDYETWRAQMTEADGRVKSVCEAPLRHFPAGVGLAA